MSWLWSKKIKNTVVVVDVRSSSVSAGYVLLQEGKQPHIVHSVQYPVEPNATEPLSEAMPRTLETVLTSLIHSGSAKLHAMGASAKSDHILVTISSPWQTSSIVSVKTEKEKPFTFTHNVLEQMTAGSLKEKPGWNVVSQLVLSTFLNGYETQNAFGREAKMVEAITLTTAVDEVIYEKIKKIIRSVFHQKHIDIYAFLPELYSVLKDVLPAQKEYLICDVGSDASDIILVKHGLLVSSAVNTAGMRTILDAVHKSGLSSHTIPTIEHDVINRISNSTFQDATEQAKDEWLGGMKTTLATIAAEEPLPRLVCIVSEPNVSEFVRRLLDAPQLRNLWLSDEPLPLLSLSRAQFAATVTVENDIAPSLPLYVLASSSQKRYH